MPSARRCWRLRAPAAGGVRPEGGAVAAVLLAAARRARQRAVAALFAIMTKVGIYLDPCGSRWSSVRPPASWPTWRSLAGWPLALATLGLGAIGALAARDPARPAGLPGGGLRRNPPGWRGVGQRAGAGGVATTCLHSTWIAGGLFLLADLVARQRGDKPATGPGPGVAEPRLLGGAFFIGAIAVAGLPPLSGFFGKIMLLQSVAPGSQALAL